MELKVWVEGLQKIVSGVTESTTCQVRSGILLEEVYKKAINFGTKR